MVEFRLDWERHERIGLGEALLCEPKSPAQIEAILQHAIALERRLLLTRLASTQFESLSPEARAKLDYDAPSRTAFLGGTAPERSRGRVAIVCGGTSDLAVSTECARTLAFEGEDATLIADVGVAGLWRLTQQIDLIRSHRIVIAVAGMEGALFSVLGGLVPGALIAVPTSIGYGVGQGGRVALDAALATCASGIVAVNIDNGFGAAQAALRMLRVTGGA